MDKKEEIIISKEEVKDFEKVQEMRNALRNLIFVCEDNELLRNEELYNKFLSDYAATLKNTESLWDNTAKKYGFTIPDGNRAYLDFGTGKISFLPE